MDAHPSTQPLFTVRLRGAPEIFSARRTELETTVRRRLEDVYGSPAGACSALHAYLDSLALEPGEIDWQEALNGAVEQLGVRLLPGARFECELALPALAANGTGG